MNNCRRLEISMMVLSLCLAAQVTVAQAHSSKKSAKAHAAAANAHKAVTPDQIQWSPAPNSLPSGAQIAVLDGNPMKPGSYTLRLKFPDGFKIPAHWHPAAEHVTVISCEFHLGMGAKWDESTAQSLPAGGFAVMGPHSPHYGWAAGETVVQLQGAGPFSITYVNPSDDPRNKKP